MHGPLVRPTLDAGRMPVEDFIEEKARVEHVPDPENPDRPSLGNRPSSRGVMTHRDDTAHAHARLVRRLQSGTRDLTIHCEQDEVCRVAFISAFAGKIAMGEADLACVQFQTAMDFDRKRST